VGTDEGAAGVEHHQHRRLHAAHLQRHLPVDHAPCRKAERPVAADERARVLPIAVYVWENEILEVLPGLSQPKYPPVKAIAFHTRSTSKFYGDDYAVDEE
jgi:hypothetical protein